jgi:SOS-response transcriptional repressor LexA
MRGPVIAISGQRTGAYVVLEAWLPLRPPQQIGILLIDSAQNRAWLRMRRDFEEIADPEDAEVLAGLEANLRDRIEPAGAEECLAWIEDTLSNVLRAGPRTAVEVDAFTRALERLYRENVEPVAVEPFRTHLPLYSLRAAAGGLGEEMQSLAEDWVPAPEGMRLAPDLFVARVAGRSMEPRIPDGSLNLFRLQPHGSRQNKILLIERFGVADDTARFTIKKYTSRKVYRGEDQWQHEEIRLEPLNPEFEPWNVEPQDFAVVAEWLRVIE